MGMAGFEPAFGSHCCFLCARHFYHLRYIPKQPLQDSNLQIWEPKSHALPFGEGARLRLIPHVYSASLPNASSIHKGAFLCWPGVNYGRELFIKNFQDANGVKCIRVVIDLENYLWANILIYIKNFISELGIVLKFDRIVFVK